MKSLKELVKVCECIISDASNLTSNPSHHTKRDLEYMRSRVKHEGLSFLTITLPNFGTDFINCLSLGKIDSTAFRSYRKVGRIPAFLQGITSQVFDVNGDLLCEPDLQSIDAIRQITSAFKKLKVACTLRRVDNAIKRYREDEQDISVELDRNSIEAFKSFSASIWTPDFCGSCRDWASHFASRSRHGPGATAERHRSNGKYAVDRWHERLEPFFPVLGTAMPIGIGCEADDDAVQALAKLKMVAPEYEQPVRIVTVPKTLKTPRIIAIEPCCMQFVQQGLSKVIVNSLNNYALTAGHILFDDQSVHQRLALQSSRDLSMATIDLSAASDRVPMYLAQIMFDGNPDLRDAVLACRSTRAELPDATVLPLKKFASMGSALCFPVQAMYFFTLCVMAIHGHTPPTPRTLLKAAKGVFIYGDDIIVPIHKVHSVIATLQKYHCKVGMDKSFFTGRFRESCGMDAYDGHRVTPVYYRSILKDDTTFASTIVSQTSTCNQFYKKGYWKTADYMRQSIEADLRIKLPIVGPDCEGLGLLSFQPYVTCSGWNKSLQRANCRTFVARPIYRSDVIDSYAALAKSLLIMGDTPPTLAGFAYNNSKPSMAKKDCKHLVRTARHNAVALRYKKNVCPY